MILAFNDLGAEDIFNGQRKRDTRKIGAQSLWKIARRKPHLLDSAAARSELRIPPDNRLEALAGDRKGQHSKTAGRK